MYVYSSVRYINKFWYDHIMKRLDSFSTIIPGTVEVSTEAGSFVFPCFQVIKNALEMAHC